MCHRHSFILTRAGKVLDGLGLTDSHTEIRELHGLKNTDDSVNAYEWQPPAGWPDSAWENGLTKDTEVFLPKSSHLDAMGRHVKALYPTMAEWDAGDKPTPLSEAELRAVDFGEFITVPNITLRNGQVVKSFRVAKYAMSRGPNAIPISSATEKPWHSINYTQARAVTARAGLGDLRLSQALAISWDICQQDINWTGGKVGEGRVFMGLHKGNVSSAQPGNYESKDPEERRWHQLSNGERIYDWAGNLYQWMFDDVQGDEKGVVSAEFSEDSITLQAPYPSETNGMGWRPDAGSDWSGDALFRGGCWCSGSHAGVFHLSGGWPVHRYDNVGFRCTQSGL